MSCIYDEKLNRFIDFIIRLNLQSFLDETLPRFSDLSFLIAIILSARTRDANVRKYCAEFLSKISQYNELELGALTVETIRSEIANINLFLKKSITIHELIRLFLEDAANLYNPSKLRRIKNIGPKTINVFLNYTVPSFSAIGVDTHVLRITNRILGVKMQARQIADLYDRCISFEKKKVAQNMIINFGRRICKHKPLCSLCEFKDNCDFFNKKQLN